MKNKISAALAAALILLCLVFAGCNEEETKATPDEAALYATADEAQTTAGTTAAPSTAAATTQPATQKNQKSTSPSDKTQPTTQKPVQDNIPPDNMTAENINPNLSDIIGMVISEINGSALRAVELTMDSITIKPGEVAGIKMIYDPEDAVPKTCTAKADSKCVEVDIKNGYLTITGKSEGTAMVTVTAYSGAYTQCAVTVTGSVSPEEITDDTVLPHAKLCTRENAERWLEAVDAYCAECGLTKNTALSGESVVVSTADYDFDGSFNSYRDQIVTDAAIQIDTYTGRNYQGYEYNCLLEPDGSDFKIAVTLYRKEA